MFRRPSSRRVASRYLDAALFEPPPAILDAARYFFVSRWGSGVLKEIQKKERSQKARLRKARKMLREQEASVEAAARAEERGESFDLLVYHLPAQRNVLYAQIRKRVIRYTAVGREYYGDVRTEWEVDRTFSMDGIEFSGGMYPGIRSKMGESYTFGTTLMRDVVSHVEEKVAALNDFKSEVTQAVNTRKANANLLSKGASFNETLCKMDLTGWKLWERRVPDEAERSRLEAAMQPRKTLKMKFDPQDTGLRNDSTGGFHAYWSSHKWEIVFAGLSGYWSVESLMGRQGSVKTDQFKQSLRELDRVVAHEMKHYAQSLLKELLTLPDDAGHPGLTDPSEADVQGTPAGKEWTRWDEQEQRWVDQRIPHESRDIEFENRLGDEVDRFLKGVESIEGEVDRRGTRWQGSMGDVLRKYFTVFTARESLTQPSGLYLGGVWTPSRWFYYLRQNDPKRYRAAVAKFTAELDRLGYMKRMDRGGRLPIVVPNHPAWGIPVTTYLQDTVPSRGWNVEPDHAEQVRALREYGRFVDSLKIDQLRRHRTLARENGGKEYWLTPRWQDHIVEPLSREEMGARRTEASRIEHPRIKRSNTSRV